jgi:hypothetical protein
MVAFGVQSGRRVRKQTVTDFAVEAGTLSPSRLRGLKNEKTWAVQAKCYSPNYEITKSDVDKFLSESNRKEIHHRLLIATTDRIGANARQVLDGQEKSAVRYHL